MAAVPRSRDRRTGPRTSPTWIKEGFGKFAGKTLLDLCKATTNIDVRVWDELQIILAQNTTNHVQRGSLPFRVWKQIYDEMVGFVRAQKLVDFVCAAGILSRTTSATPASRCTRASCSTALPASTTASTPRSRRRCSTASRPRLWPG